MDLHIEVEGEEIIVTPHSPWQVSRIVKSPSFRDRLEQAFRYKLMEVAHLRVGGK